jgi:RNA polymerase sigma factor (sigma-70 family)
VDKLVQSETLTDEQLAAEAAREGSDGPAFVALVDRFQERIWRICYRLMSNEADAHDATQEVFVRMFVHRAKFEGRSKYSTWLHSLAVRTCLTMRRGRGRRQQHEEPAQAETLGDATARHETSADTQLDLLQMLEILDDEDRALVLLKYTEDYSYDDLAQMFGISESACKMRIMRAKEKIQRHFQS